MVVRTAAFRDGFAMATFGRFDCDFQAEVGEQPECGWEKTAFSLCAASGHHRVGRNTACTRVRYDVSTKASFL